MSYFLCGQTGNVNRGCEAIIRSTVKVLSQNSGDVFVATFSPESDREMARELGVNLISYDIYPTAVHRMVCGAFRKIFKGSDLGMSYKRRTLESLLQSGDICLNIGGDTYCYGRPELSISFNKYTSKNNIDNYFWCCSVEKNAITKEVKKDLNRYKKIFAREQITYDNIISSGIDKNKVIKVCDPAFFLDKKEVELPKGFALGNTVGLNVSECVLKEDDKYVYSNVLNLAKYILEETDMSICLIPHVYSINRNVADWPILNKILADLNSDRVSIADKEYNCEELKYIISKLRFMVCARTHASIAAYSSCVPTLVLGYSVKSKGIARDLFGTDENYVVSYNDLTEKQELTSAFKFIVQKEEEIRTRLNEFLPEYKKQLSDAVKKYIICKEHKKEFEICSPALCTGCGACAGSCPQTCIEMKADDEGFLRPEIDFSKCISCGKCRMVCPVINRYKDDNKTPQAIAANNKDEEIRLSSSSGGVFFAVAEKIIESGGVVFGAGFDEDMNVVHKFSETVEGIKEFKGSKYVQSKMGNSYLKVKEFLDLGKEVLFTGTPCQIGGLYAYLGKEYNNLYTFDFICHGVPSPEVWKRYVEFQEKKAASKTQSTFFRHKKYGWKKFSLQFKFSNCSENLQILSEDLYMQGFLADLYLRPSCYQCSFKNMHRMADITLADFWGIDNIAPEFNDDKGTSLVLVHSPKGESLWSNVFSEFNILKVDFDSAIKSNPSYLRSVKVPALRKIFFRKFDKKPIDKLISGLVGRGYIAKLRRILSKI